MSVLVFITKIKLTLRQIKTMRVKNSDQYSRNFKEIRKMWMKQKQFLSVHAGKRNIPRKYLKANKKYIHFNTKMHVDKRRYTFIIYL